MGGMAWWEEIGFWMHLTFDFRLGMEVFLRIILPLCQVLLLNHRTIFNNLNH